MRACIQTANRFVVLAMLAPLVAACTTTSSTTQAPVPVKAQFPRMPQFIRSDVDPALANPCVTATANRYYLPEKVIYAVNTRSGGGGNTDVIMKADSRDALCSISANGTVRSVVDISPMSADQMAANEAARKAAASPAAAPVVKAAPSKKKAKS